MRASRDERSKEGNIEHFMFLFNGFKQFNELIGHFPFGLFGFGLVLGVE